MQESELLLVVFIVCIFIYNYIGLYISGRSGAKIPLWSEILKSKDYTYFLLYVSNIGLIICGIFGIIKGDLKLHLIILGFIFIFLSIYVNIIARKELAKNWTPLANSTEKQGFVTSGIYSRIRHPIYFSVLLLSIGFMLIAANFYGLIFFILSLFAIYLRIKKEELILTKKFGDRYLEYKKRTHCIFLK